MIWTDFSDIRGNPSIQSTSLSNNRAIERQKQISTELHENHRFKRSYGTLLYVVIIMVLFSIHAETRACRT